MIIRNRQRAAAVVAATACLLVLFSMGCATKKWIQTKVVEPMDAKIHGVDQKSDQNAQQIKDVDQRSEQGISEAKSQAENASKQGSDAQKSAQNAQTTADKGVADAASAKDSANAAKTYADNLDVYQPVKSTTVLFHFGKANLDDEDKQKLEDLIQTLPSFKHYALEVQGYTDKSGSKDYNLALSQQRADSVVRYLTENGRVPLVRIHVLGYGEDEPVAPNNSSKSRKLNRRVEVRILASQTEGSGTANPSASSTTSSPPASPTTTNPQ